MEVSSEQLDDWRQQSAQRLERSKRCSSCRHLSLVPTSNPGLYIDDEGVCGMHGTVIPVADVHGCDGWQSAVHKRRDALNASRMVAPISDVSRVVRGLCDALGPGRKNDRRRAQAMAWLAEMEAP